MRGAVSSFVNRQYSMVGCAPSLSRIRYARTKEDRAMNISVAHLHAIVAIGFGILILVVPRLLSYLVAIYLILTGLIGLGISLHLPR